MCKPTASQMLVLSSLLLFTLAAICDAVQVARVSPSPVGDASHRFRHDAYIDGKVRRVVANFLNHEDYHHRNVILPSSMSDFLDFGSNLTTDTVTFSDRTIQRQFPTTSFTIAQPFFSRNTSINAGASSSNVLSILQPGLNPAPTFLLNVGALSTGRQSSSFQVKLPSQTALASFVVNASKTVVQGAIGPASKASGYNLSVATGLREPASPATRPSSFSKPALIGAQNLTNSYSLAADSDESWEIDTDKACSAQLSTLGGTATNPSGISACYNVQNLDETSGVFSAELRLYRIAAASGDWTDMQSTGFAAGMAYPDASVTLRRLSQKRDLRGSQNSRTLEVGSHLLMMRSSSIPPSLLQTLSFLGQVKNSSTPELYVKAIALALLTPKINLAGSAHDGSPISTQLSLQDASFVNGLFSNQHFSQSGSNGTMVLGSNEWISKANSFSAFPTSLVLVAAWTLMLGILEGYGFLEGIRCRNEDRRRMVIKSSKWSLEI